MSISRSDECYFPRADLVIQVENTLFKLHQDILERHSGFFEDMFSVPTNDDTEGTEENPLVLPSDLCSARSFTMLFKFLYRRVHRCVCSSVRSVVNASCPKNRYNW
ncbi:hypothetical protein RSAG8_13529, partial [Rhizoctonia solani AG-8 WAC10335]